MGHGNLILANDTPENREVLGLAGLYNGRNDSASLAELMRAAENEPALKAGYGPQACGRARELYNGEDVTDWCIPYQADWPELGSLYGAPSMSLAEAMQGGANLVVTGQPGSGKSVTMAHFATQIIRSAAEIGNVRGFVPLFPSCLCISCTIYDLIVIPLWIDVKLISHIKNIFTT